MKVVNGHVMYAQPDLKLTPFFVRNVIIEFTNVVQILQVLWTILVSTHLKSVNGDVAAQNWLNLNHVTIGAKVFLKCFYFHLSW